MSTKNLVSFLGLSKSNEESDDTHICNCCAQNLYSSQEEQINKFANKIQHSSIEHGRHEKEVGLLDPVSSSISEIQEPKLFNAALSSRNPQSQNNASTNVDSNNKNPGVNKTKSELNLSSNQSPVHDSMIVLRVFGIDSREIHFQLKMSSNLYINLKQPYAKRVGIPILNHLRFIFHGQRISDEDTPRSLQMEEKDVIEVYLKPGPCSCPACSGQEKFTVSQTLQKKMQFRKVALMLFCLKG